ncbi:MAG: ATP-binding cassette domain-containing protein [Deltaproteobacteria bacterium]|nr:ATP-binding cassette domain-containing protein [Deltaproteobacteria bacterium]
MCGAGLRDRSSAVEAPIVAAAGLRKRYDKHEVVCGVDFTVRPRECFGLLGPNGAGKTTTIRMLTGFAPIDAGTLSVFGLPVGPADVRAIKSRIGVAPQEENLDPDLTVAKNLLIYASYFGIRGGDARARVAELLAFAALADRAADRIPTLSGGMKRRLVLARALVNRPRLLVLDEPTTGLDPQARHLVWERLRELKRSGVAMLLTTHYMEEAAQLCDRLVVMNHGRIIAEGTPRDLIERYVGREVVEIATGDDPGERARVAARCRALGGRVEEVGDHVLLYLDGAADARAVLAALASETLTHRRATLEDVFLTLTGRELRE